MKILMEVSLFICGCLMTACSKYKTAPQSETILYTLELNQIKLQLKGTWYIKSECNTTISGTSCRTPVFESLTFTANDTLVWLRDNVRFKKEKIIFTRITAPKDQGYITDSLYIFELAESKRTFFPFKIKNDSLVFINPTASSDAGYKMVLTRHNSTK